MPSLIHRTEALDTAKPGQQRGTGVTTVRVAAARQEQVGFAGEQLPFARGSLDVSLKSCVFEGRGTSIVSFDLPWNFSGRVSTRSSYFSPDSASRSCLPVRRSQWISTRYVPAFAPCSSGMLYLPSVMTPPEARVWPVESPPAGMKEHDSQPEGRGRAC